MKKTADPLLEKFEEHCEKILSRANPEEVCDSDREKIRCMFKQFYLFGAMDALVLKVNPGDVMVTIMLELLLFNNKCESDKEVADASDS